MHSIETILAVAAVLIAMSPAAHALELFTPPVNRLDGTVECHILKVGTKPIEVSAAVKDVGSTTMSSKVRAVLIGRATYQDVVEHELPATK